MITYCRLRPARAVTVAWAQTCRREGTTTLEGSALGERDVATALAAGLLPVGGPETARAAAWVLLPGEAEAKAAAGVAGWRLTVLDRGSRGAVGEALRRTGAAYLRTGRSRVAAACAVAAGSAAAVSVFVDDVAQAVRAVEAGAGDLLLRDWDGERLGELRSVLAGRLLVERGALPPGVAYRDAHRALEPALLRAWLDLTDASGAVRPRHPWAPGRDLPIPPPPGRLSAEWADPAWEEGGHAPVRPALAAVLERCRSGVRPGRAEVALLLTARGSEVEAVACAADERRRRAKGDVVTYVVNHNINYTNSCRYRCGFCAFSRQEGEGDPEEWYLLSPQEVAARAAAAAEAGATEVCLQGGIHPAFTGDDYVALLSAVKAAAPAIHVHAFSPQEVWQGARSLGVSLADFLRRLRDSGLGSLPGTAAEVLDDEVRRVLCPGKVATARWVEVVETAHLLGIPTSATIMFGHVEGPAAWAQHLEVVRRLQERTGGFTEFVPLPFVHMEAPLYRAGRARPGPTWDEVVLMHAVARLALDGAVDNVQASWVKLGLDGASALLRAGANDLGGTLGEESISRAAGATHGCGLSPAELKRAIVGAGRVPARRTTLYRTAASEPSRRGAL